MEMVEVKVSVPKEFHELADGIVELVQVARQLLADGFQPAQDLPAFAIAAYSKLPAMIGGIDQLPAEIKADKGKIALALALAADKIV
jgi:hypothetical protein